MLFNLHVPGGFWYLMNKENYKSNWKKILGCRNMQEKLEKIIYLVFFFSWIIMIRNSWNIAHGWLQDAASCRQIDRSKKNASNCSSRIIFSRNGNFWWAKKTKTVVAAVRRRRWSWWFVFLPFIHPQFLTSVLEFQAKIHEKYW